jgi:hypothetical protein
MSSSLLPPAAEETARPFEVSDSRINTTSLVLGGYVLLVIYPAYALLRYWWTDSDSVFSVSSAVTALVCAVLFGLNVRRRVRSLAQAEPPAG